MAWVFRLGNNGIPLASGAATDAAAVTLENPVGTPVWQMTPAGVVTQTGGISPTFVPAVNTPAAVQWVRAHYDFAVLGGAVSTIPLMGATNLPNNSTILGGWVQVTTGFTSADSTATVAIQVNAANDTINAAAVSGAPWSTTGRKAIIPVFTAATMLRLTAARDISMVIGVEALTAGVCDVVLCYTPGF